MLLFPSIKPYLIQIGPVQVRWYGLMYIVGLVISYLLVKKQVKADTSLRLEADDVEDLYFYMFTGLIIGARIGYILFYNLPYYIGSPAEILAVWHGGMSFHGGFIGTIVGGSIFCRKKRVSFLRMSDIVIATAPLALACGRLGNFINAELYGRVTTVQWGMVFPDTDGLPRHPSQLYELSLEGIVLFIILWSLRSKVRFNGGLLSIFFMLYGLFRIICELFREPDIQLGYIMGILTMGQILSGCMIIFGISLYLFLNRRDVNGAGV